MHITPEEIVETLLMVAQQNLDIRTVTLGMSLDACAARRRRRHGRARLRHGLLAGERARPGRRGARSASTASRSSTSASPSRPSPSSPRRADTDDVTPIAVALDRAAAEVGVDFIGGFSALVQKGIGEGDRRLIDSIPAALATTERVCSSVNVASTRAGINMDAVLRMAEIVKETAELHRRSRRHSAAASSSSSATWSRTTRSWPVPSTARASPTPSSTSASPGPGVVRAVVSSMPDDADLTAVAEAIKATAFKITRAGELVAREAARRLGVAMGIVDLSLAPTPAEGDSVAEIIEAMGVERCGGPGTTAALALLNDAVKKGGAMGTSSIGGLSGAFIPVSEDEGMIRAVQEGALTLEKLEAMTAVCSVGPRHDRRSRRHDRRDDRRHHQRRVRDRHDQRQDDGRAPHPGRRQGRGRRGRLRRALRHRAGDGVNEWAGTGLVRRGGRVPAPLGSLRN